MTTEANYQALLDDSREIVSDLCARFIKTLGEMSTDYDEHQVFLGIASSQFLGAGLDLWIEIHGCEPNALKRFVDLRLEAKKSRDSQPKPQNLH